MGSSDYAGNVSDTLPGTNQIIPAGTKYGPNVTSRSNKLQAGRLPRAMSAPVGPASRANPMGSETTLNP